MVTVEKVVGEGGVPAARRAVGEADLMVPKPGESNLFLLTPTSPPACLHLSPSSTFLTLSLKSMATKETRSHYYKNNFVRHCPNINGYLRIFEGSYFVYGGGHHCPSRKMD